MELTALQEKTKEHVLDVFKKGYKGYLIADEVGLGKTIIAGKIIDALYNLKNQNATDASKTPTNGYYIVYYICGNERVAVQNCIKLREICNEPPAKDVRLSMQWQYASDYKKNNKIIILPLSPATTFTNTNSTFNKKEALDQNAFLTEKKDLFPDLFNQSNRIIKRIKSNDIYIDSQKNVRDEDKNSFLHIRETIITTMVNDNTYLPPNLILLDEFQNYSLLLYGRNPLFSLCLDKAQNVLMLSATPYEMESDVVRSMTSYDDHLTSFSSGSDSEIVEDCSEFTEEPEKRLHGDEAFLRLIKFVRGLSKKIPMNSDSSILSNSEELYQTVLCRSERSMFYDTDKESEIDYIYCSPKQEHDSIHYIANMYKLYKLAYENAGLLSNEFLTTDRYTDSNTFISLMKECPALASFATRYRSLKKQKSDIDFCQLLQKHSKEQFDKLFADQKGELDPFNQASLNLVREQTCPEGIEKVLWIPPSTFSPHPTENDNNPFVKCSSYTKSLLFGNYRMSTAAPAALISEYIRAKQTVIISDWESKNKNPSIVVNDFGLSSWWPNELDCPKFSEANLIRAYTNVVSQLKDLVKTYLKKNIKLILAVTDKADPLDAIKKYTEWGDLKAVIQEYAFLIGLTDGTNKRRKLEDIRTMLKNMTSYFNDDNLTLNPTKILCFTAQAITDLPAVTPSKALKKKCSITCEFAERFTDDDTDLGAHRKAHQKNLQDLFNAPFYPFLITSTSVAQEGLDFHNYCHRMIHWSVARTPVAYEQREGRIDRYLSHLMRKRIALCGQRILGTGNNTFELLLRYLVSKRNYLEKKSGEPHLKPLFPYWYLGKEEYKILTGRNVDERWPNFIRVICALPNSREGLYFSQLRNALKEYNYYIGMTYQTSQTDRNFCPLLRK